MNRNIIKVLVAAAMLVACFGCGKDDTTPSNNNDPKEINIAFAPESLLTLEGSESGEVAITATGKDARDLTAKISSATAGWVAEIADWTATEAGYSGRVLITAPAKTSTGSIWVAVQKIDGSEFRAKELSVACKGIDAGEDPYSTPAEQCHVKAEQIGGSPVACNVALTPDEQVTKYYYTCYPRKEFEKYDFFYEGNWRRDIRNSIVNQLNEATFDYWIKKATVFRYDEVDDGENEVPLSPNTEYYVAVVAQLKDGTYTDLEITHLQTLPKSEREYVPTPAEHVKVTSDLLDYDGTILTLEPDDSVECFRYGMVDDYKIEDYIALYGKSWNVGYTDLWMYNLKYYYPEVYPEGIITGKHTYIFDNLTPSKNYHLLIVYEDKAGDMHLEVTDIRTNDKPAVKGKPQVDITRKAITESTITFLFEPNGDCGRYTVDIWSESDAADFKAQYRESFPQMIIQYANRYGKVLDEATEVTLDINNFYPMASGYTRYWTSNDYELVVMPFDKEYVYDETAVTYLPIRYTGTTTAVAKRDTSAAHKCSVEKAVETPERGWTTKKAVKIKIMNK